MLADKTGPNVTDKTRPSCLRCLKSGYVCKGYDLGLRMQSLVVVTEPEGSQRLARIVAPSVAPPAIHHIHHHHPQQEQAQQNTPRAQRASTKAQDRHDEHHKQPEGVKPERLGPAPEMNLSAFQEHMAFSYFFATYGWAYFWKPFLHLARETDLAPNASRMCSLALAYGHMGISKGDKRLKSTGLELYGKTLREVQSSLSKGVDARSELARLCVPVVILGMYSVCLFHAVPPITPYHMSTCLRRVVRLIDPTHQSRNVQRGIPRLLTYPHM